jgi:hypothetical protein
VCTASCALVSKLRNYCNILRDDGLSYGDYVQQLMFLLSLKMAHERTQPPYNQPSIIPEDNAWPNLVEMDGIPLEHHYRRALETRQAEAPHFQSDRQATWSTLDADLKGVIYEGRRAQILRLTAQADSAGLIGDRENCRFQPKTPQPPAASSSPLTANPPGLLTNSTPDTANSK